MVTYELEKGFTVLSLFSGKFPERNEQNPMRVSAFCSASIDTV